MNLTREKAEKLLQRLMKSDDYIEGENAHLPDDRDSIFELLNAADTKMHECVTVWSSGGLSTTQMREVTDKIARTMIALSIRFDQMAIE